MTNLVLGFATNQSAADCAIFINSLRHVYSPEECDLVLIVDRIPEGMSESDGTRFWRTINGYPFRNVLARKSRSLLMRGASLAGRSGVPLASSLASGILEATMERWHHPHFARWLAYRRFLREHPHYDQVLLTDVRDVLFQRPFFHQASRIQLFEQDQQYGTGNCDSDWYREAWGEAALVRAEGRPAICIGTVLGPRAEVCKLIRSFIGFFAKRPFQGIEQALFNGMLHAGDPAFVYDVNPNIVGSVATLASPQAIAKIGIIDGQITTLAGDIVPIVHMYDRHEETQRVAQQYIAPMRASTRAVRQAKACSTVKQLSMEEGGYEGRTLPCWDKGRSPGVDRAGVPLD